MRSKFGWHFKVVDGAYNLIIMNSRDCGIRRPGKGLINMAPKGRSNWENGLVKSMFQFGHRSWFNF